MTTKITYDVGDQVVLIGGGEGIIRYKGRIQNKRNKTYYGYGIEMTLGDGDTNGKGKYDTKQYFNCSNNKGRFVCRESISFKNKWLRLASSPLYFSTTPLMLSDKEILISPGGRYNKDTFYKYNIDDNEWIQWFKSPNSASNNAASLNKNKTKLYIYNTNHQIIQIDLKTKQSQILQQHKINNYNIRSLFIDGQFHLFCRESHFMFNKDNKSLNHHKITEIHEDLGAHSVNYIPSKQSVIIIPGREKSKSIYLYSMLTNKCNKLSVELIETVGVGCSVLTKNEQFIIIFGSTHRGSTGIQILDLRSMSIKKSNVECYESYYFTAAIRSDKYVEELLTFGYMI